MECGQIHIGRICHKPAPTEWSCSIGFRDQSIRHDVQRTNWFSLQQCQRLALAQVEHHTVLCKGGAILWAEGAYNAHTGSGRWCVCISKLLVLNQSTADPPAEWKQKAHCSHKLSCVVLSQPQTLPSHHYSPSFYHSSCSGFLTLGFLPSPQPSAPPWPPFDPLLPPHPPLLVLPLPRASPQLQALCAFNPLPSPPPLPPSAFVCERPAKGARRGRLQKRPEQERDPIDQMWNRA